MDEEKDTQSRGTLMDTVGRVVALMGNCQGGKSGLQRAWCPVQTGAGQPDGKCNRNKPLNPDHTG